MATNAANDTGLKHIWDRIITLLSNKVDKVTGKGLSTNDYTTAEKSKLDGIESGAQVNTVSSVAGKTGVVSLDKSDVGLGNVPNVTTDNQEPTVTEASTRENIATGDTLKTIIGKIKKFFSDLKAVAFSGSYNDLSDQPTIPTKVSDLTNDSGFVTTDEKVTGEERNPSSGSWQYVPFIGTSNQKPYYNNGLMTYSLEGTSSATGRSIISVGNIAPTGTAGNKRGELRIYSEKNGFAVLKASQNSASERLFNFPDKDGTIALTNDILTPATAGTAKQHLSGDFTWQDMLQSHLYFASACPEGYSDKPYHLVAQFEQSVNEQQINTQINLLVTSYYSPRGDGVLWVSCRWEANGIIPTWVKCVWLTANSRITTSNFVATWKYNSTTKIATIKLYAMLTGWASYSLTRLSEHEWSHYENNWILYNSKHDDAIAAIPSDETQVAQEFDTIINPVTKDSDGNTITSTYVKLSSSNSQKIYTSSGDTALNLRSAAASSWIGLRNSGDTFLGSFGVDENKNPKFYNGSTYDLVHAIELTGTLAAGSTTLTLSNSAITTSSAIDVYTDKYGVSPTDATVSSGSIVLTFDVQSSDLSVKVRVS